MHALFMCDIASPTDFEVEGRPDCHFAYYIVIHRYSFHTDLSVSDSSGGVDGGTLKYALMKVFGDIVNPLQMQQIARDLTVRFTSKTCVDHARRGGLPPKHKTVGQAG
jgi:hypothetical protein